MSEFVDETTGAKSCWSVTGWALAAAFAVVVASSVLSGTQDGAQVSVIVEGEGS